MPPALDVLAVGHALIDVLAHVPDDTVAGLALVKGTMALVEGELAGAARAAAGPDARVVAGGSAANTAVGLASLGDRAGFVGKVGDDPHGRTFSDSLEAAGVRFVHRSPHAGVPTGTSVVLVTPDAARTMCTDLGAGAELSAEDVVDEAVGAARLVYLEGYLCGTGPASGAVDAIVDAARRAGSEVALSLSDPAWVGLQHAALDELVGRVDVLFANELEATGLTGATSVDEAVDALAGRCATVAVTLGAAGCLVARGADRWRVPAAPVAEVVDTTGAGDLFAAGFLHAYLRGADPGVAARVGALTAAEVIGHLGARPEAPLQELVAGAFG